MRNRDKVAVTEADVMNWFHNITNMHKYNPYIYDNHIRHQVDFISSKCEIYKLEDGVKYGLEKLNRKYDLKLDLVDIPKNTSSNNNPIGSSKSIPISLELQKEVRDFYKDDYIKLDYKL